MNKKDIKLGDKLYWNTTGAYEKPISLNCYVMDIGVSFIWIMVNGNLSPTPVKETMLSREPKNVVTNK